MANEAGPWNLFSSYLYVSAQRKAPPITTSAKEQFASQYHFISNCYSPQYCPWIGKWLLRTLENRVRLGVCPPRLKSCCGFSSLYRCTGYLGDHRVAGSLRSQSLVRSATHPETVWTDRKGFITKSIKPETNAKHPMDSVEQRSYLELFINLWLKNPWGLGLIPSHIQ